MSDGGIYEVDGGELHGSGREMTDPNPTPPRSPLTPERITELQELLDGEAPVVWLPGTIQGLLDLARQALQPRIPSPERMKEMADQLEDVIEGPHNFRTYHILKIAKELRDAAGE